MHPGGGGQKKLPPIFEHVFLRRFRAALRRLSFAYY
nr:MAG TPA: hypothetical protein [Caudoviricetes sp.]